MTKIIKPAAIVLTSAIVLAIILVLMGRDLICPCGRVDFWAGPGSPPAEGSQHLLDLYSPSHLIHGFVFFGVLALVARRLDLNIRLALSLIVEAGWEVVENTPLVIDRYRAVTISLDYNGDSVINSIFDLLAMVVGFYLARVLPVWVSVFIVIGLEVLTAFLIRDGLVLNVLMLFWPVEHVLQWQQGV